MNSFSGFDLTAFLIPGFLLFVALEYLVSRIQKKKYFSFENAVVNLSIGIAERVMNLFILGMFYGVFDHIQKKYGVFQIPNTTWTVIFLFLGVDFVWYWYHRFGHQVNVLWSAHVVHHQSEEFNYTVSARVTLLQAVIRNAFWCVLPLLGFSADALAICLLVHGAYPFFIHTQTIGKLGILEYIFVTPSHHRVHHASNEIYLDKNFGDVLIVWDRLFNTFKAETETPVYGLTKQLKSHSFLWQHFHQMLELIYAVKATHGIANKLKLVFGAPSGIASEIRERLELIYLSKRPHAKRKTKVGLRFYVATQVVFSMMLLFVMTLAHNFLDVKFQVLGSIFIVITLVNCGAILDQRTWVFYPEYARMLLLVLTCAIYCSHPMILGVCVSIASGISFYFENVERKFIVLLYGQIHEEKFNHEVLL